MSNINLKPLLRAYPLKQFQIFGIASMWIPGLSPGWRSSKKLTSTEPLAEEHLRHYISNAIEEGAFAVSFLIESKMQANGGKYTTDFLTSEFTKPETDQ